MSARPILFSGPMVRAILNGRKTQTRRVVKPQPGEDERDDGYMASLLDRCPYGQPGDLLWVRETIDARWGCDATYSADDERLVEWISYDTATLPTLPCKRIPSIYMSRWASRLTLRITDVRVERVQDISEEDARAEGYPYFERLTTNMPILTDFRSLWDSINAKRGYPWKSNPWVWVIGFEAIQLNVEDVVRENAE